MYYTLSSPLLLPLYLAAERERERERERRYPLALALSHPYHHLFDMILLMVKKREGRREREEKG